MEFDLRYDIPPAIRRFRRWHLFIFVLAALTLFAGALYLESRDPSGRLFSLVWPIAYFPGLVGFGILFFLERRVLRRAARAHFAACTHCTYPLPEIEGICPECGKAYRRPDVVEMWTNARYGRRKQK